ncbi:MAG: hypothetical protein ACRECU_04995 [Methylocella sp.]
MQQRPRFAQRKSILRVSPRWASIQALATLLLLWVTVDSSAATCDAPAPVTFRPGAFAADVTGGVPRGLADCWTVQARAGQRVSAKVTSPEHNVVFQIYQPGWTTAEGAPAGQTLPGAGEGQDASVFSGILPETGTYLFVLGTTRGGGDYRLRVKIR